MRYFEKQALSPKTLESYVMKDPVFGKIYRPGISDLSKAVENVNEYRSIKRELSAALTKKRTTSGFGVIRERLVKKAGAYKNLRKFKVPLTPDEYKKVLKRDAMWRIDGSLISAIWKSMNPITKKVTYVSNTNKVYQDTSTLNGAINLYHKKIKEAI